MARSGRADDLPALVQQECAKVRGVRVSVEGGAGGRGGALNGATVVVDHWTATPRRGTGQRLPSRGIVRDGLYRPDLGYRLPGPLYNVLIDHDFGQPVLDVVVIATGTSNNAGRGGWRGVTGNSRTLGVCCDTDGTLPWSARMIAAMAAANVACMRALRIADVGRVCGHYEWTTRKIDPGKAQHRMAQVRAATAAHGSHDDDLLEEIMALDPNSPEYKRLVADIANAVRTVDVYGAPLLNVVNDAKTNSAQARDYARATLDKLRSA